MGDAGGSRQCKADFRYDQAGALRGAPIRPSTAFCPVLRQREDRMAIVVNEFGSAIGMITMEDIVEEVSGRNRRRV